MEWKLFPKGPNQVEYWTGKQTVNCALTKAVWLLLFLELHLLCGGGVRKGGCDALGGLSGDCGAVRAFWEAEWLWMPTGGVPKERGCPRFNSPLVWIWVWWSKEHRSEWGDVSYLLYSVFPGFVGWYSFVSVLINALTSEHKYQPICNAPGEMSVLSVVWFLWCLRSQLHGQMLSCSINTPKESWAAGWNST